MSNPQRSLLGLQDETLPNEPPPPTPPTNNPLKLAIASLVYGTPAPLTHRESQIRAPPPPPSPPTAAGSVFPMPSAARPESLVWHVMHDGQEDDAFWGAFHWGDDDSIGDENE